MDARQKINAFLCCHCLTSVVRHNSVYGFRGLLSVDPGDVVDEGRRLTLSQVHQFIHYNSKQERSEVDTCPLGCGGPFSSEIFCFWELATHKYFKRRSELRNYSDGGRGGGFPGCVAKELHSLCFRFLHTRGSNKFFRNQNGGCGASPGSRPQRCHNIRTENSVDLKFIRVKRGVGSAVLQKKKKNTMGRFSATFEITCRSPVASTSRQICYFDVHASRR